MSTFAPVQAVLEPAGRPDTLSSAVMNSLSRPIYGRVAWGPFRSFVFGAISLGIIPLIAWPRQFGRFVVAERQQFWHLVEWLRVRTGDPEAEKLRDRIRITGAPPVSIFSLLVIVILAAALARWIVPGQRHHLAERLIVSTYAAAPWRIGHGLSLHPSHVLVGATFFGVWTLCLSAGYLAHWLHVRRHVFDVNQLLSSINGILSRQHLPPVPTFGIGIGLRPLWLLAGLIGVSCGAFWAIPAALAGAIHQKYVRQTSTRLRGELAMRAVAALSRQRPAMDVPMPHGFRFVCRNKLCGKTLPGGASFCPRCGTCVPAADAVA